MKISVAFPEPELISEVLQSTSVKISADETLTTDAGTSASIDFTANVQESYSNGLTKTLSSNSYVLTWNASNVEGLSFSDGTLIVRESVLVGTHEIQITATAVSNDLTGTDCKTVIVTVREVATVSTIPVLTCTTPSMIVQADTTPQEQRLSRIIRMSHLLGILRISLKQ